MAKRTRPRRFSGLGVDRCTQQTDPTASRRMVRVKHGSSNRGVVSATIWLLPSRERSRTMAEDKTEDTKDPRAALKWARLELGFHRTVWKLLLGSFVRISAERAARRRASARMKGSRTTSTVVAAAGAPGPRLAAPPDGAIVSSVKYPVTSTTRCVVPLSASTAWNATSPLPLPASGMMPLFARGRCPPKTGAARTLGMR